MAKKTKKDKKKQKQKGKKGKRFKLSGTAPLTRSATLGSVNTPEVEFVDNGGMISANVSALVTLNPLTETFFAAKLTVTKSDGTVLLDKEPMNWDPASSTASLDDILPGQFQSGQAYTFKVDIEYTIVLTTSSSTVKTPP